MLSDIGRDVIFKKMTNIENCSIFAVYQGQVVGGCVFTPHFDLNFIELHFLGVDQRCQNSVSEYYIKKLQGIGSKFILELKLYAQRNEIPWIVTYADNNKFDVFFRKQGFGDQNDHPDFLKSQRVTENIEHYIRATLSACRVEKHVDYVNIKSLLQTQMNDLIEKIKSMMLFEKIESEAEDG